MFQNFAQFGPTTHNFHASAGSELFSETMTNTNAPVDRSALAAQIADVSLLRGEFTLRSGKKSSYYLDKYRFSTRPEILIQLAELFREEIEAIEAKNGTIHRLAGAELGGIPLVSAASIAADRPSIFIRNAKKDYGTANQLEGTIEHGDRVVFLEDVATTGGQSIEAIRVLGDAGAVVCAVVCVIDRQEGARENITQAGVEFRALFTKTDLGV